MTLEHTSGPEASIPKELAADLDEVTFLLRGWAISESSDSVHRQQLRKREYSQACQILEGVYYRSSKAGLFIRLSIPKDSEEIRTKQMDRNAYDLVEVRQLGAIKPGESLLLKDKKETWNVRVPYPGEWNVYYGDFRRTLEVADIARTLRDNGGRLDFVSRDIDSSPPA